MRGTQAALAVVLLCARAHAGELDDVQKIAMKPAGTTVVVDAGKAPTRVLAFRFVKGAKRAIHLHNYETIDGLVGGERQQTPPKEVDVDGTVAVTKVTADGGATITMSGAGGASISFDVTAQGKVDASSSAAIALLPGALPTEKVGVGARWQIFSDAQILGVANPSVTVVTVTAIDGDKVKLHMVQDIRIDAAKLGATMGGAGTLDSAGAQNVADLTLDLTSPGMVADSTQISVTRMRGTTEGKSFVGEFVALASIDAGARKPASLGDRLIGTWDMDSLDPTPSTITYRRDGTGTFLGQDFHWTEKGGELSMRYGDAKKPGTSTLTLVGDLMIDRIGKDQVLWRRAP